MELKVPSVGESISQVEIGEWLKAKGEFVAKDETVVTLESDKATVELPAPISGVIGDVVQILHAESLYSDAHQKIFIAIRTLYDKGHPADLVTLAEYLREQKHIEDIGGYPYLAELWDAAPTAANAEYYARIVREKALLRSLASISTEIASGAYDSPPNVDEYLDESEHKIFEISERLGSADGDNWLRRLAGAEPLSSSPFG